MRTLMLAGLLLSVPVAAMAQDPGRSIIALREGFARYDAMPLPANEMRLGSSHWKTGAFIGGSVFGAAMAGYFYIACSMDDRANPPDPVLCGIGGFVGGALMGALVGGLIGSAFPKD